MEIALFDLDHTLIPFDSGNAFARFLIERGVLDEAFEAQYLVYCHQYIEGTLDMRVMHRFTVGALKAYSPETIKAWLGEFEREMAPRIPAGSVALVREHRAAGRVCALVTATTRFVAECFARTLGLEHVLATEPEVDGAGYYTGEIVGVPCFRDDKVVHVERWLAGLKARFGGVERSWFYTDSINDIALMEAVSDPVAVSPDASLAEFAGARGWLVARRDSIGLPCRDDH